MNWMTVTWPAITSACVTLAFIHLWIWFRLPDRTAHLWFFFNALSIATISAFELVLMRTADLASYQEILRWAVVPIGIMTATTAGFVYSFFGTGRLWLALTAVGLNASVQIANLVSTVPVVRNVVAIHEVEGYWGAKFTIPTVVNGPWNLVGILSMALMMLFVADASFKLWKKGERRRVILVGGSIVAFLFIARLHAILIENGILHTPYLVSIGYLGVLLAMGHELSVEVLNAAKVARQLRESEQSMKLVTEAASIGLWVWDAGRDEVWMTETGRNLFGFESNRRLKYEAFHERVHPDDRQMRDAYIKRAMETKGSYGVDFRVLLPDGELRWLSSRASYMDAGNGKGSRLLGVSMDITAKKQAELQLSHQRDAIAHLGRVSMMGQLSSALAHELSQPLGAILRNAEAAELFLEHDAPDLDELRHIITDIRKDDQRASGVIDRLRALLKRRDIASSPLAISDVFNEVIQFTQADATTRQVAIAVETAPDLPRVLADRIHLQQVLLNLVLNAMDALNGLPTGQRRVTLRAGVTSPTLVEIAVSDTGHGIAPEKLANVFDPFFTTKEHGMGMGLAISRTIIEAHGGSIRAENNAGNGATFCFTLPVEKKGPAS